MQRQHKILEPTDWCAGMVVVPKRSKDDFHADFCADYTNMNEADCKEKFNLPSVEHTLGMLSGATVFS